VALLFYWYAKGIFSSRKIERAPDELLPVLYITGGTHPDHNRITTFRQRFLRQWEPLFVQLLRIAHGLGSLKRGDVSSDGTKIQANASQHKAMSGAYAEQLEETWRAAVQTLWPRAETAGGPGSKEIDLPAAWKRREDRLPKIAEVTAAMERRAQAR
jgi:hypothetical protein